ncbi:MAG: GntR family transcriptional regulator, partial [Myxococcales bacterium]
ALQRLAAQGLVTLVSHRGAFVKRFSPKEILDLYELRIALEETAAGLAAERITKAEGHELLQLVESTADEMSASTSAPYPRGNDLHSRIADLSRNDVLAVHLREVHMHLALARVLSGNKPDRAREALGEHQGIVQAIASGDRPMARQLMGDHMRHAMENALRVNVSEETTSEN